MCKGNGCNVMMDAVTFNLCTLVAVDGAAVALSNCHFTASSALGAGISLLAHWAGTRVHASNCSFTGGQQCIAVHSGASFQGRKIQCSRAELQAVEVKDAGSKLSLSGSCSVSDVDVLRKYISSKLFSKGVFVHSGASATLAGCSVVSCVRCA